LDRIILWPLLWRQVGNYSIVEPAEDPVSRPPPFRPNFLGGLLGGAAGLRKVQRPEEKDEAIKEAEAAARKAKEKSEQLRLWPELQKIAVKEKNEIAFEDVQILQEIGRGVANLPASDDVVNRLKWRMDPFIKSARSRMADVTANLELATRVAKRAVELFGLRFSVESEEGDPLQRLFLCLSHFLTALTRCARDLDAWHDEDVKKEMKLAAARFVRRLSVTDDEDDESGSERAEAEAVQENLFNRFRDAQEATTQDLINEMKKKMAHRQKKTEGKV
jgi:hypothetical protein